MILREGKASGGFDEFLLGILEVTGVLDFGVFGYLFASIVCLFKGLVEEILGFGEVVAMDRLDAFAAGLDEGSCGFECIFPGGMLGVHFGLELGDGLFPGHGYNLDTDLNRYIRLMVSFILGLAIEQAVIPKPHAFWGDKCDSRQPQVVSLFFSPTNKIVAFARDGEMRWYDNPKLLPVRTAKLSEIPVKQFTPEEKAENERLVKMHESMWGDIPFNYFTNLSIIPFGDRSSFYITDLRDQFFQYSTATGELERKVRLQYKTPLKGSVLRRYLDRAGEKAVFQYSFPNMMSVCFDLKTGKELSRYPTDFIGESIDIAPNGQKIYITRANKLFAYDPLNGKQLGAPITLPEIATASILVSPDSKRIAYSGYDKNGEFQLNSILDLESGKTTKITAALRQFFVGVWTPDGKHVGLMSDGYIHFADTATGEHEFSYTSGFPDLWNRSGVPDFTQDSSTMAFVPEVGADIQVKYFLVVDMKQPRNKKLIKIGP